jgi:hypothetical protein
MDVFALRGRLIDEYEVRFGGVETVIRGPGHDRSAGAPCVL